MARGRKKGGLNINNLSDRTEIINMIINQINSLNKKIKVFKNEGIEEHSNYIQHIISDDMGQFTENGTLSKSKQFYGEKNIVWLKKTLSALHKINNHAYYGTVRKYHKEMTNTVKKVQDYVDKYLTNKGYNADFIYDAINSKEFMTNLFDAYKEVGRGFGSNQAIEKIVLNYGGTETGFNEEEMNKILSNIEYAKNVADRLKEEQDAFDEFMAMRNKAKR